MFHEEWNDSRKYFVIIVHYAHTVIVKNKHKGSHIIACISKIRCERMSMVDFYKHFAIGTSAIENRTTSVRKSVHVRIDKLNISHFLYGLFVCSRGNIYCTELVFVLKLCQDL